MKLIVLIVKDMVRLAGKAFIGYSNKKSIDFVVHISVLVCIYIKIIDMILVSGV